MEALGGEPLFISDESKEPLDDGTSRRARAGLHNPVRHEQRQYSKTYHEVLWCPDTYDFARGLSLGSHSSPLSAAVVAQSRGRVFPFLDPSASPDGSTFLFLSPLTGGRTFLLLLIVSVGGVHVRVIRR